MMIARYETSINDDHALVNTRDTSSKDVHASKQCNVQNNSKNIENDDHEKWAVV